MRLTLAFLSSRFTTSAFTTLPTKPISGTKAEAESSALELAKKWIDPGKPEQ
jgi:hypothetical protein